MDSYGRSHPRATMSWTKPGRSVVCPDKSNPCVRIDLCENEKQRFFHLVVEWEITPRETLLRLMDLKEFLDSDTSKPDQPRLDATGFHTPQKTSVTISPGHLVSPKGDTDDAVEAWCLGKDTNQRKRRNIRTDSPSMNRLISSIRKGDTTAPRVPISAPVPCVYPLSSKQIWDRFVNFFKEHDSRLGTNSFNSRLDALLHMAENSMDIHKMQIQQNQPLFPPEKTPSVVIPPHHSVSAKRNLMAQFDQDPSSAEPMPLLQRYYHDKNDPGSEGDSDDTVETWCLGKDIPQRKIRNIETESPSMKRLMSSVQNHGFVPGSQSGKSSEQCGRVGQGDKRMASEPGHRSQIGGRNAPNGLTWKDHPDYLIQTRTGKRNQQTQTTKAKYIDEMDDGMDSDGTWDDGVRPVKPVPDVLLGDTEEVEMDSDSNDIASEVKTDNAPDMVRLLSKDYYLKFSENARNTLVPGSKRSYAELANTRRHIVERRQLKKLIARCVCGFRGCSSTINPHSIKIKECGFVIRVTASCSESHPFFWESSVLLPSEKKQGSNYALNTAAQFAILASGNSHQNIAHFAKVLRLSCVTSACFLNHSKLFYRPVIQKCFNLTQQEMMQNLKENASQIVLAGDGQFDSPGSCATLCSYALMALGVDEKQEDGSTRWKKSGYVISQAVIDRRHAENKSMNMERMGLHWAMQPVIKAGIKVAELVTDDHVQVSADFRKIAAAVEEQQRNDDEGDEEDTAFRAFQESLTIALKHCHPKVDVETDAKTLLQFYGDIVHSNDIWHRAKNLLKSVSTIAQCAPTKEQPTYRRYAKMLRNYLWECAEGANGNEEKFLSMWSTVSSHLRGDHQNCPNVDLHSKTELMEKLDQKTRSFDRLLACIRRIEEAALQICRFRQTGILESYNSLALKYSPKRSALSYDTMIMRRQLTALDHNHHVIRPYKILKNGNVDISHRWRKSTKGYSMFINKEDKDYAYIGHLMAAMLYDRCQTSRSLRNKPFALSAANPKRIQRTLAPVPQSVEATCLQWISKQKKVTDRVVMVAKAVVNRRKRKRMATPPSYTSEESDDEHPSKKSKGNHEQRPKNQGTSIGGPFDINFTSPQETVSKDKGETVFLRKIPPWQSASTFGVYGHVQEDSDEESFTA